MKSFLNYIKGALALTVVMLAVCGFAYPAALTGLGQVIFPHQANGSLLTAEGEKTTKPEEAVGSALVGQDFSMDNRYFQGRVSSVGYNMYDTEEEAIANAASGNYNYGATNEELEIRVQQSVEEFLREHPDVKEGDIPADLLTASGSGLDPHITPESAEIQIPAVAENSGLSEDTVRAIVERNTEGKALGIYGEECVNVLKCNLELAKEMGEI